MTSNIIDFQVVIAAKAKHTDHNEYIAKINEGLQLKRKWIRTVTELLPTIEIEDEAYNYLKLAADNVTNSREIDYLTKVFLGSFSRIFWMNQYLNEYRREHEIKGW